MSEAKQQFDVVVIGAGPGGYVAALRAVQNGKSVALIEREYIGGTCLNVGCIPTKTMVANAHMMHKLKVADQFGFNVEKFSFDYKKMKERKDSVVQEIVSSLEMLIKSKKITIIRGHAKFEGDQRTLKVIDGENTSLIGAKNVIIATGSAPMEMKQFPSDLSRKIYNSTTILDLEKLPRKLVVIGGGYIGCEFASLFAELGVKVTILELFPKLVVAQGDDVSNALTQAFEKAGIDVRTGVRVTSIEDDTKSGLKVLVEGEEPEETDAVLVSVGRSKVTDNLGLSQIGIGLERDGSIFVDNQMRTRVDGVYAIGDVTGKSMLAHVASHQGIVAADHIAGKPAEMHYDSIPAVIFTHPEIAMVGKTRDELEKEGVAYRVGKYPFFVHGKSKAAQETEGFAQVLISPDDHRILGAQIVGSEASSMISEVALAMANELTADCIGHTIHAHPTLPEAIHEAAMIAMGTPVHN